ncbi:hypothetical protein [Streptomyces flavofungini]|uniref:hypothetical protein n=1 Tax=Streptomyces flavofungini TaxID=68200 RepID=UPI0025AFBDEB|nr:hypothetical protein [Streptomyces flavofungini]WJV48934.1 hypothetical protein QUY26_27505 [Streptomyces flavofungini]
MSPLDPCPLADRQVCQATRDLARAVLRRLGETAAKVEPRIKTIVVTRIDAPSRHVLWRLHGDDGRLLLKFDPLRTPGAVWGGLAADASFLAALADLRAHPPGYYYVHPMPDPRDLAIPLPDNPRGLAPRSVGLLNGLTAFDEGERAAGVVVTRADCPRA